MIFSLILDLTGGSGQTKRGKVSKKNTLSLLAEREGFEPPEPVRFNGFQDRRIRPLCHLSLNWVANIQYLVNYTINYFIGLVTLNIQRFSQRGSLRQDRRIKK